MFREQVKLMNKIFDVFHLNAEYIFEQHNDLFDDRDRK